MVLIKKRCILGIVVDVASNGYFEVIGVDGYSYQSNVIVGYSESNEDFSDGFYEVLYHLRIKFEHVKCLCGYLKYLNSELQKFKVKRTKLESSYKIACASVTRVKKPSDIAEEINDTDKLLKYMNSEKDSIKCQIMEIMVNIGKHII